MLEERDKAGGLAPPARPSGRALALRLRRFFADDHRFGLCVSLRLAACEDLDITQTGHHELDGVAGLAALIFPGARTDLSNKAEAGADLNGFLDQGDLGRRKDGNTMPDPMRSGKQPTQTPYGC